MEAAFLAKAPHVPSRLYKYRSFLPDHIDALNRGTLWMSSPDTFNDPYDSAVYFNTDRFPVEDRSPQDAIAAAKKVQAERKLGLSYRPPSIAKPIQARDWRRKIYDQFLANKSSNDREKLIEALDGVVEQFNKDLVIQMTAGSRTGFSVLSLTENPTSVLMWSHYSDNHRGFCIEYDFKSLPYGDLRKRLCFPVFYRRKLTDATRYMAKADIAELNNLFGQFLCLLKSDEWSYEYEWRIVFAIGPGHANFEIAMPSPSAVILGVHARKSDIDMMLDYCTKNGIALKQVTQRHDEFRLEIIDM